MQVKDLIGKLQSFPNDLEVFIIYDKGLDGEDSMTEFTVELGSTEDQADELWIVCS